MKIKISQLRKIIREEVQRSLMTEASGPTIEVDDGVVLVTVVTSQGAIGCRFIPDDFIKAFKKPTWAVDSDDGNASIMVSSKGSEPTIQVSDDDGKRIGGDTIDLQKLMSAVNEA